MDAVCQLYEADCLEVMAGIPADSFDAVVTDPPYHLTSTVKRFGSPTAAPAKFGTDGAYARASAGFMGKTWDGGDIASDPNTWRAVWRVLKPGGHMLVFGGTRTYHRMACAIEDAGFEVRDCLMWLYGTGFPKSHDVSKGIDKAAGAVREVVGQRKKLESYGPNEVFGDGPDHGGVQLITAPATSEAAQWTGWGTALKPAWEPIILARKPLSEKTVAANVLRHGTGAINIDASRVPLVPDDPLQDGIFGRDGKTIDTADTEGAWGFKAVDRAAKLRRWPANVMHDGSDEVEAAFAVFGDKGGGFGVRGGNRQQEYGMGPGGIVGFGDSGSAFRFFYSAKAGKADRAGSKHPTVKPQTLMRWLCTLITPPGGRILDPFAGSGSTGQAALDEGFSATLIEREAESCQDIRRRLK